MADQQKQIDELNQKVRLLELRQQQISNDLVEIKKELSSWSAPAHSESVPTEVANSTTTLVEVKPIIPREEQRSAPAPAPIKKKKEKTPLEEFIGTNLLNKLGIAVLVIGIGIGAKFAIDHDLISPLTRILLGYVCGGVLIALALRLKLKYENFSAVLLSGGMAVLYFITFAAYDLYQLMPKMIAFALMVIFTAFTVFAAIQYNLQLIAIIGLVGAYGVPFLLSDGSGKVAVLFTYISIINIGILILSFKKTWKALYYSAFILTWIIFSSWMLGRFDAAEQLWISLTFSTIYFITFYATLLSYKLLQREPLSRWDIVLLMTNSFTFYAWGYYAIGDHAMGDTFLGIFTIFNALIHFIACYIIYKKQEATRDTFYLVAGLVLVFLTLAVPVQLDGNWVTLIWAVEALLLFWIGREKNFPVYERLSYVLIVLTFFSLVQDWSNFYQNYYDGKPYFIRFFLNIQFLSSMIVTFCLGAILKISLTKKAASESMAWLNRIFEWALPAIFITTLYLSFFKEISTHWDQRYISSEIIAPLQQDGNFDDRYLHDQDLPLLKSIWLMIYSAIFITLTAVINFRWTKNSYFSYVISGAAVLLLFSFIVAGLPALADLRDSYITQADVRFFERNSGNILIRYVSYMFMIPLLWVVYKNSLAEELPETLRKAERIFFHFVILALLSSELINVLGLLGIEDSDKLALSILWGAYALGLIVFGLIRNLKFVRITGIGIFGITLIKLFFYDLSSMGTIAKTVVMMILGILLLVASFLYNKFKIKVTLQNPEEEHASEEQ